MKSFMIALTLDDDEADLIDTSGWAFGGNDPEHARANSSNSWQRMSSISSSTSLMITKWLP